jgi:hypothetical protein
MRRRGQSAVRAASVCSRTWGSVVRSRFLPGGLALAVQADHTAEVIRLDDLRDASKIC